MIERGQCSRGERVVILRAGTCFSPPREMTVSETMYSVLGVRLSIRYDVAYAPSGTVSLFSAKKRKNRTLFLWSFLPREIPLPL